MIQRQQSTAAQPGRDRRAHRPLQPPQLPRASLAAELDDGAEERRALGLVISRPRQLQAINDDARPPYGDELLRSRRRRARGRSIRAGDTAARVGGEEFALDPARRGLRAPPSRSPSAPARRSPTITVAGFDLSCLGGRRRLPARRRGPVRRSSNSPTAPSTGPSAAASAAPAASTPSTRPATGPTASAPRSRSCSASTGRSRRCFSPSSASPRRVVGYEALARFPGTSGRTPDIWFAQAHGCGLGAELEAAAIRAALEPTRATARRHTWRSMSVPPRSPPTCVQRALRGNLEGLVIEITEHEFVPDDDSLAAAIADLRARGARSRSTTRAPVTPASSS